jgi:NAD(P)-dependent dehydrogenase (short-subunit alcohol dehydrogenase family)
MTEGLAGKVAIITGAADGIGRATSRKMAAKGARVLLIDLDEPRLAETKALESGSGTGTDHDRLQVRVYVEQPLAHDLPAPSRLTGRMFVRETDTSVPLMFVRVPPHVSLKIERSDEWQERVDVPSCQ